MTRKQMNDADQLKAELIALYPGFEWRVHWNYYTKLPEFIALNERGGYYFQMIKTYSGDIFLSLNFNDTARGRDGAVTSEGMGVDLIRNQIPRVNFARYLEFTRQQAAKLAKDLATETKTKGAPVL